MQQRYILFQAYGNEGILMECQFALMQLLKYNSTDPFCVVLYTDNQDFFKPILQQFIHHEIIQVTLGKIKKWRGEINFVHRVKIEILLNFFEIHTGAVLYFDTDTYCKNSITPLFEEIEKGSIIMHTYEGNLGDRKSIVFKKWRHFLQQNKIDCNGKLIKNIDSIQMWNAGVIGFSDINIAELKQALQLTDSIYLKFSKHTVEQFAFSYIFQNTASLKAADSIIFHYWDLKEYRKLLKYFFEKNNFLTTQQQTEKLQKILPENIFPEKRFYKKLPFYKKWISQKWGIGKYIKLADKN